MRVILVFIFALVNVITSVPIINSSLNDEWIHFKKKHGKDYENKNEIQRRLNWEKNIYLIDEHNRKADQGIFTYWLGLNEYADMTHDEFTKMTGGIVTQHVLLRDSISSSKTLEIKDLPAEVDWRSKNYVTEVKNQENCGGCWAFSATGALEGRHFKNTGKLVSLSEQELIDCCKNDGCNGGSMNDAFDCIRKLGGIELEESYKFEARAGVCRFNASKVVANVSKFINIESYCEPCLQFAVASVGPISAAVYAKEKKFRLYKSGVYQSNECSQNVTHAILVVGYGSENGQDYWLVKNSWGSSWGLKGYFKIARNKKNMCGIASMASYPDE